MSSKYVELETVYGGSGTYVLIDPAIPSVNGFVETEPAANRPKGMYAQRTYSKKATPEKALDTDHQGALIIQIPIAKSVGLPWTKIEVRMTDGKKVPGGMAMLDTEWAIESEIHAGSPPLVRLVENPRVIMAREDIAKRLSTATGKAIIPLRADRRREEVLAGGARLPKRDPNAVGALHAALVDGGSDARRRLASKHPLTAVLYAILVDKTAHPVTRVGADKVVHCAHRYAYSLDRTIDDALASRLVKSKDWDDDCVMRERRALAEITGEPLPVSELCTRKLPKVKRPPRIDPAITDAEILADIDEMTARGLARVGVASAATGPEIGDAVHRYVDLTQFGKTKTSKSAKQQGIMQLELACAWAEALHRGLGWQWSNATGSVGVVSPTKAHAHAPLAYMRNRAKKGERENTVALLFNMIAVGDLPKARPGALVHIT